MFETYTVTAYWLRERMGKVDEAEKFLREGLRENPDSYEIMYELGRVYAENQNDPGSRAKPLAGGPPPMAEAGSVAKSRARQVPVRRNRLSPGHAGGKARAITLRPSPTWSCGRRARPARRRSRSS